MFRKLLGALAILTVLFCFGWWMFGGNSAPTQNVTVTGPAAAPSAPATTPAPAAKATEEHPTSSTVDDAKSATSTNPLRCGVDSWPGRGPLGGTEWPVTLTGLKEVHSGTATLFIGGKVTCKDQTIQLDGKPLGVDELVSAKGFRDALTDSRSRTLKIGDRSVDVGNMTAAHQTATRAHYPEVATK